MIELIRDAGYGVFADIMICNNDICNAVKGHIGTHLHYVPEKKEAT